MPYFSRKNTRIPYFDYSSTNYYFITICSYEKRCIFGTPAKLSWMGMIAEKEFLQLESYYNEISIDQYVVMPNHLHAIIVIDQEKEGKTHSLTEIIGLYKSGVSRKIREKEPEMKVWQRSFHDHIIRNQSGYEKIWTYIAYNPIKWKEDCFFQEL